MAPVVGGRFKMSILSDQSSYFLENAVSVARVVERLNPSPEGSEFKSRWNFIAFYFSFCNSLNSLEMPSGVLYSRSTLSKVLCDFRRLCKTCEGPWAQVAIHKRLFRRFNACSFWSGNFVTA